MPPRRFLSGVSFVPNVDYRQDIDVLRAIAVLSVVIFHAFPAGPLTAGFLGVDMFFVISGYVITRTLRASISAGGWTIRDFYIRRARRLLPAVLTVLLGVALLWALEFTPVENAELRRQLIACAWLVPNFYFYSATGYFSTGAANSPLLHFWSLGVEEQFYVVYPLILMAGMRAGRPRMLVAALTGFSLFSFLIAAGSNPDAAFYLPHNRAWELGMGALAALSSEPRWNRQLKAFASVAALIALAASVLCASGGLAQTVGTVAATTATAVLVHLGSLARVNRYGLFKAASQLGLASFPIYLWHWPLLVALNIGTDDNRSIAQTLAALVATLVLARLTQAIEYPVRLRSENRALPVAALVAMIGIGVAAWVWPSAWPRVGHGAIAEADMLGWDAARASLPPCGLEVPNSLNWCLTTGSAPRHAVIGDSHADHLFVGLARGGGDWLFMGLNSCPLVGSASGHGPYDGYSGDHRKCREAMDAMVSIIAARPMIRVVVLSSLGPYYVMKYPFARQHRQLAGVPGRLADEHVAVVDEQELADVSEGMRSLVADLIKSDKKVVLVEDIPELPFNPAACFYRWRFDPDLSDCSISRSLYDRRSSAYRAMLAGIQREFPTISIVHASDAVCDPRSCQAMRDGRMLYRDSHHLSVFGSEAVAKLVLPALN